jgi:hypothetical protein
MAVRCIGCDEDLLHKFLPVCRVFGDLQQHPCQEGVDYISDGALRGPSRDFQGKSPRSGLHWLYGLVEGIVLQNQTFFRVKIKIFDRVTTMLVHYFLLEGVAFGESLL